MVDGEQAQAVADRILANVDDFMDGRIAYAEFCARQERLWDGARSDGAALVRRVQGILRGRGSDHTFSATSDK